MAQEIAAAYVSIYPKTTGFGEAVNQAVGNAGTTSSASFGSKFNKGVSSFAVAAGNILSSVIGNAAGAIGSSIGGAIARVDTLNNFSKVMANMGISADAADAALDTITDRLHGLPTTLDAGASAVQRFTSSNLDIAKSTDYFLALNDALIAGGQSTEIQASALEQLSQSYSKGRMDMMEWRSLQQAMPAQLNQIASAMGLTADALGEGLRNGSISMDEFMDKIVELDSEGVGGLASFSAQARDACGGIQTSMTNLRSAVTRNVGSVIKEFNKTDIISRACSAAGDAINGLGGVLAPVAGSARDFIDGVIERGAVKVRDFAYSFQQSGAVEKMGAAFDRLKTAVQPVIDAIGGKLGPVIERVAMDIAPRVTEVISGIMDVLSGVMTLLGPVIDILAPIAEFLGGVLSVALYLVHGALEAIGTIIEYLGYVLKGLVIAFESTANDAASAFGGMRDFISGIPGAISGFFSGIAETIGGYFQEAYDKVTGKADEIVSYFTGIPDKIAGFFSGLGQKISDAIGNISLPHFDLSKKTETFDGKAVEYPGDVVVSWWAKGGIFNGPSVIGVGEAGPEAVVPLSGSGLKPLAAAIGATGVGSTNVYINNARVNDDGAIERKFLDLMDTMRRKGMM